MTNLVVGEIYDYKAGNFITRGRLAAIDGEIVRFISFFSCMNMLRDVAEGCLSPSPEYGVKDVLESERLFGGLMRMAQSYKRNIADDEFLLSSTKV